MPITSKFSDEKVEQILSDLVQALEKNEASTELSLMCLGNIATNLINCNVPLSQRKAIAEKFAQALMRSIDEKPTH
ncbi:hypothetical protein VST7929_00924 [Vibrio stylophorae]|uniref:UPF0352 protein VST7929_00924 n=1 Tax=Vibrio stylophorae TaxID=659351 RepID=A0ABN8DPF8_9VIBR|nr:YejL family protein [Vibrio stylophorae]CAH0533071.1 hypothetical protein VST7929_00924 [Vibrio stylophorae]